jgi:hypothetical protein
MTATFQFPNIPQDQGTNFLDLILATNAAATRNDQAAVFGEPTTLGVVGNRAFEEYPEALVMGALPGIESDPVTVFALTPRAADLMAIAAGDIGYGQETP